MRLPTPSRLWGLLPVSRNRVLETPRARSFSFSSLLLLFLFFVQIRQEEKEKEKERRKRRKNPAAQPCLECGGMVKARAQENSGGTGVPPLLLRLVNAHTKSGTVSRRPASQSAPIQPLAISLISAG